MGWADSAFYSGTSAYGNTESDCDRHHESWQHGNRMDRVIHCSAVSQKDLVAVVVADLADRLADGASACLNHHRRRGGILLPRLCLRRKLQHGDHKALLVCVHPNHADNGSVL